MQVESILYGTYRVRYRGTPARATLRRQLNIAPPVARESTESPKTTHTVVNAATSHARVCAEIPHTFHLFKSQHTRDK